MDQIGLSRYGHFVALHRRDGTFVAVSDALAELLGYTADELVGTSGWLLAPEANGEHRERVHGTLEASGALNETTTLRCRDGTLIRYAFTARVIGDDLIVATGEPVPPDGFVVSVPEDGIVLTPDGAHSAVHVLDLVGEPGRWLTTKQAVEYTNLSKSTFDRRVNDGTLPRGGTKGKRLFHTSWLDALLLRLNGPQVVVAVVLLLALLGLTCAWLAPETCHWLRELGLKVRSRG